MGTCTICASLKANARPESHPALRRRSVSHRFLDVFETYVCLKCGANWERTVLNEDTQAVSYRWTLTAVPIQPTTLTIPNTGCTDLDHALASWIRPTFHEQADAY
jgi:hypothetical protein